MMVKMVRVRRFTLLSLAILASVLQLVPAQGGGMRGDLARLLTAVGNDSSLAEDSPLRSFAPSTPAPDNINCYVEVPATRMGGRCVELGSRRRGSRRSGRGGRRRRTTWGCQAGVHLAISTDCRARRNTRRNRRNN